MVVGSPSKLDSIALFLDVPFSVDEARVELYVATKVGSVYNVFDVGLDFRLPREGLRPIVFGFGRDGVPLQIIGTERH